MFVLADRFVFSVYDTPLENPTRVLGDGTYSCFYPSITNIITSLWYLGTAECILYYA